MKGNQDHEMAGSVAAVDQFVDRVREGLMTWEQVMQGQWLGGAVMPTLLVGVFVTVIAVCIVVVLGQLFLSALGRR